MVVSNVFFSFTALDNATLIIFISTTTTTTVGWATGMASACKTLGVGLLAVMI